MRGVPWVIGVGWYVPEANNCKKCKSVGKDRFKAGTYIMASQFGQVLIQRFESSAGRIETFYRFAIKSLTANRVNFVLAVGLESRLFHGW